MEAHYNFNERYKNNNLFLLNRRSIYCHDFSNTSALPMGLRLRQIFKVTLKFSPIPKSVLFRGIIAKMKDFIANRFQNKFLKRL